MKTEAERAKIVRAALRAVAEAPRNSMVDANLVWLADNASDETLARLGRYLKNG